MEQIAMLKAIELGAKAKCISPPNPWVGCTILKDGRFVGEGWSSAAGEAHAEINALQQAGAEAKGATAYITLEPCCHQGRTPPCTRALIQAGIKRVVIALEDPDPKVQGKGIAELKEAGIEVEVGMMHVEASNSLAPYLHQRTTKTPWCVLKAAISLDGRIAAADGTSKWITSEEARRDAHRLRAESQAILIGSKTALLDKPLLTVRDVRPLPTRPPLRVALDPGGKIPSDAPLFDTALAPTLIFTTDKAREETLNRWRAKGADVLIAGGPLSLPLVLEELEKREVIQLLVEGGASTFQRFVDGGFVNQLELYVGSKLLGSQGKPLIEGLNVSTLEQAPLFSLVEVKKLGNSARLSLRKEPPS